MKKSHIHNRVIVSTCGLLIISLGLMIEVGIAGTTFVIVFPVLIRTIPVERRQWVLGIGITAASISQFLIVPVIGNLLESYN